MQLEMGDDGVARLDLPRVDMGQGVVTAMTMLIADELDLPLRKVEVTTADARPELLFNQITAGSATMRTFYDHVRTMASIAAPR
ncbi:MAG: molybdopterin cofactor-binding domain-containing protein [Haloechinothrix sp.]